MNKYLCLGLIMLFSMTRVFAQEGATLSNFTDETYDIVLSSDPLICGAVSGGGTYAYGAEATISVTLTGCCTFVNWIEKSGLEVTTNQTYTFTVTESRDLIANFNLYSISLSANPWKGGDVFGDGYFRPGIPTTISAVAKADYNFVNWTRDDVEVSTEADYTFITGIENIELVANFAPEEYEIVLLANPPEGGEVDGGGSYPLGEEITICATPNFCYDFVNWTDENGEVVSTDSCYTFTVTRDHTLIANFVLAEYEIIILCNPPEGGTVTGGGIYACGTVVTISAVSNPYCDFIDWTDDNGVEVSTNSEYSFTVTGPLTLIANFDCGVGIEQLKIDNGELKIHPNPTTGELTVETDNYPSVQNIEIFDMMGRKVQSLTFNVQSSEFLNFKPEKFPSFGEAGVVINISNFPSGIYFVRIQTENGTVVTKKIVKQ